jgi:hypothetical protein
MMAQPKPVLISGHIRPAMMHQLAATLMSMRMPAGKIAQISALMSGHASNSTVTDLLAAMTAAAQHDVMAAMPVTGGNVVIGLVECSALNTAVAAPPQPGDECRPLNAAVDMTQAVSDLGRICEGRSVALPRPPPTRSPRQVWAAHAAQTVVVSAGGLCGAVEGGADVRRRGRAVPAGLHCARARRARFDRPNADRHGRPRRSRSRGSPCRGGAVRGFRVDRRQRLCIAPATYAAAWFSPRSCSQPEAVAL